MSKKCIGCGIVLQNIDKNIVGYTDDLDNGYCERCFRLKNYGEYKDISLNNSDFNRILRNIPRDSLVVYVVSLLNINFDFICDFSNVLVVLTKRDLLPKSVKDDKLISYVKNSISNYLDIEIVSAVKNYNLDSLINKIDKYGKDRKVYFVGMTNSGKSTLINTLIRDYSSGDANIVTSMYPSTTLNQIEVMIGNHLIIDTPGILSDKSILNSIGLKDIKRVTARKEIKPRSYQLKGETSLLIDSYLRMDIYNSDNITFYLANNLNIVRIGINNDKLRDKYKYSIDVKNNEDIVIEDLCFIKFQKEGKVNIYSPYVINVYTRNNLI